MANLISRLWWAWRSRCKDVRPSSAIYRTAYGAQSYLTELHRWFVPCKVCGERTCRWASKRSAADNWIGFDELKEAAVAEQTDEERILENALGPRQVSNDSGSAEQHPIADQIAALNLKKGAEARTARRNPFRLVKFSPPGMND